MRYRSEIDGLRALSILAVLAFHADLGMPGGFLGVDIFFVISGYLITALIEREMAGGSFSLIGFYRRRILRVLPALLLVLVATCIAGSLVLLPGELRSLSSSAAAAAAFSSNVFFWRETAYFGGMGQGRPLLHTWSLGVEEQFYLFYPLLLGIALKWLRRTGTAITLLVGCAGSLALCLAYADSNPVPIFYLLPSRFWELGLGGVAALLAQGSFAPDRKRQVLAWTGLLLVITALALAEADTGDQQLWAVVACTGAALVLCYGEGGAIGRLLSVAPLRGVGLISYSLYLWHWPIIALLKIVGGYQLSWTGTGLALTASLVLAILTYRFVEQPFRRRYRHAPAARVVVIGIVASIVVAGAALALKGHANTIRTLPPAVKTMAAYSDYWRKPPTPTAFDRRCMAAERSRHRLAGCPAITSPVNVLLTGDSHAGHIRYALKHRFPGVHVIPLLGKGCRPLIGAVGPPQCTRVFRQALQTLVATGKVQAVVLAGQWHDNEIDALINTIRVLRSHQMRVTIIGPIVEYNGDFPNIVARAMLLHDPVWVDSLRRRSRQALDRRMAVAVRATGAQYFSSYDRECPNGRCRLLSSKGEPMHYDYGHYTRSASVDIIAGLPHL
jgi:peptidoglycan/LPS O-acetylase OafA/YrhL